MAEETDDGNCHIGQQCLGVADNHPVLTPIGFARMQNKRPRLVRSMFGRPGMGTQPFEHMLDDDAVIGSAGRMSKWAVAQDFF